MRRIILAVIWLVLGVALLTALWVGAGLAVHAGLMASVTYTDNPTCRKVTAPPGAEDIVIDRATGWAYLSATDRRWGAGGGLYAMRLDAPERGILSLTGAIDADLRPHGISLWQDAQSGEKRLFAVTHSRDGLDHAVVIFALDDTGAQPALSPRRTIRDPLLVSPNDVAATGPESFYATNDARHPVGSWARLVETYTRADSGSVVQFDGEAARIVADGLTYANGIALSEDGTQIFVAETADSALRLYDRDRQNGTLSLVATLKLGPGPDNIDVDREGRVVLAQHPKLFAFQAHAEDGDALSPTVVRRLRMTRGGRLTLDETLYADNGAQISGGSVGAWHDGHLLVGSVFEPHIVHCTDIQG